MGLPPSPYPLQVRTFRLGIRGFDDMAAGLEWFVHGMNSAKIEP